MGRDARAKYDRTCPVCGDIRLRTAKELQIHVDICKEAQDIEDRLHAAGLSSMRDEIVRL